MEIDVDIDRMSVCPKEAPNELGVPLVPERDCGELFFLLIASVLRALDVNGRTYIQRMYNWFWHVEV